MIIHVRCARCRRCNMRVSSGTDLSREGLCTTCSSLRKCPKCSKVYNLGEKIIKCNGMDDDYIQDELEILSSSGRGRGVGRGGGPGRRVPKLGVGGFFVKIPRHRLLTMEDDLPDEDGNKRQKRPRKPRRSQLEDAYPPAIQEGFFGMRPVEGKALIDAVVEEPSLAEYGKGRTITGTEAGSRGHELSHEATEQLKNDLTEVDILEHLDIGEVDLDNMDMDFTSWMEDDEDDDFDDSLNGMLLLTPLFSFFMWVESLQLDLDAFDIVKADGFEPTTNNTDSASTSSTSAPNGPTSQ
ncbi:unnamed protein product [Angiostrongylus costaricensis]|uniref:RING-type domain-containing protein n=1 Tax=Angiostrongylus costaricensis TaxID=334426 RepID=A0A0R3PWF6_ANGCS|nr:unnamed protein product [Angiostrongylus costaricensis]